jgi:hypothetical protein|tara:strand:+ start:1031 stop:1225 length:195 start_codon:yes stop_codon:yes gene_type:complete
MSIKSNNQISVSFVNVTMKNINEITDDIYECLMDEDYIQMNLKIKELNSILREIQKLSEHEIQT